MQTIKAELLFFKTLRKNSCACNFADTRIRFLAEFLKKPLKYRKFNLPKINFFKVDNNNDISNRVSEIQRKKFSW